MEWGLHCLLLILKDLGVIAPLFNAGDSMATTHHHHCRCLWECGRGWNAGM